MTRPSGFLARMILILGFIIAGIGAATIYGDLIDAFMANVVINGIILFVFVMGVLHTLRMVGSLAPEVNWIESFQRDQASVSSDAVPRLLSPMATMLGERSERARGRLSLSTVAMRTLLDGISTRLDERREYSRYMIGLLIFLGLLGTFWGLLQTVSAIGQVIGELSVGGDMTAMFESLKAGLESPLGGMGTAFSSSLFGLAGSLALGILDLVAGHAQNRFYNELEDWLSGLTRLSGGIVAEGEGSVPAYIQALLEKTADSLERLERTMGKAETNRGATDRHMLELTEKLSALGDQMRSEQHLLVKLAEAQAELKPVLGKLAETVGGDPAIRQAVRNMDKTLTRVAEEASSGRAQTLEELRGEIRLLARTVAAASGQPAKKA